MIADMLSCALLAVLIVVPTVAAGVDYAKQATLCDLIGRLAG